MSREDIKDWNRIAHKYQQFEAGSFINRQFHTVLWEALGDVNGLRILDLGCGAGWLSGQLQMAGAHVLGIDGSSALLETARASYPEVEFCEFDLSTGLPSLEPQFDFIVACMVLMDIPDLTLLIPAMRAALKPGGRLIFTMQHPCFFNIKSHRDEEDRLYKKLTGYLQPETWRMQGFGGHNHYHRSLTYYFDHLRLNRMAVTRLYEPPHVSDAQRTPEEAAFYENIPIFMMMEAVAL